MKEPNLTLNLIDILNQYSSDYSFQDSKKWALEWLYENDPTEAQRLAGIKEFRFSNRGFVARLLSRGYNMDPKTPETLLKFFKSIPTDTNEPVPVQPSSPQSKKKVDPMTVNTIVYQLEDVVDAILSGTDIPPVTVPVDGPQLKLAKTWIEKELIEAQETLRQQELIIQNLQDVYSRCGGIIEAAEKTKKAKAQIKPKTKPNTALLKSLRYSKGDETLGIQSVSPLKIIGAKKLLAYNTETRMATLYIAEDKNGLTVSGSSIKGYDEEKSYSLKIRKPELFLAGTDYMNALKEQRTTQGKARGLTSQHTVFLSI